jgi:urease accessory protein
MSSAIYPSERDEPRDGSIGRVRVRGGVSVSVDVRHGRSRVCDLRERDGYKVRFPRRSDPPEGIIINTGGGLASGDDIQQSFDVADGAALTVTTQASERSYRSADGSTTRLSMAARVGRDASLIWLPQETILFDGTRLSRSIDIAMASSSRLLIAETVVFGRIAMGETLESGLFQDKWRIRREGRLVFAENIKLNDETFQAMTTAAMNGGAHVTTTLICVGADAEDFLQGVRSAISDAPFQCAASAWNGMLVVRGLAHRSEDVRHLMARLVPALSIGQLPRVWWT